MKFYPEGAHGASLVTILLTKLEFLRWSAGGCEVMEKCWKAWSPVGYQVLYLIPQNGVGLVF